MTDYCTVVELKAHLQIPASDTSRDTPLGKAITSASRAVELWCGDRVFALDAAPSMRVYAPTSRSNVLQIDDVGSLTGLAVATGSAGTYVATDPLAYEIGPLTALVRGRPLTTLTDLAFVGLWWAPGLSPRVQVTARWGWPAIPDPVSEATMITAARLYRRGSSPEGVAGFADMGVMRVTRVDPDVQALLQPFMRYSVV